MNLLNWLMAKFTSDKEKLIVELRKEIEKLRRENKDIKEKVIKFPQKTNEEIQVEFYDDNIQNVIIENISQTKHELCIAVAWFTSCKMMDEVKDLKSRGVKIKVIIDDNEDNQRNIYKLVGMCMDLKIAAIYSGKNGEYKNKMHNKYYIIDNSKVIDGSYNWTNAANYNDEHIVIIKSSKVAKMFKDNFDRLYNKYPYFNEEDNMIG